jgi:hypothetical protein
VRLRECIDHRLVHGGNRGICPDLIATQLLRRIDERDIVRPQHIGEGSREADVVVLADFDKLLDRGLPEEETQAGEREHNRNEARDRKVAQQPEAAFAARG